MSVSKHTTSKINNGKKKVRARITKRPTDFESASDDCFWNVSSKLSTLVVFMEQNGWHDKNQTRNLTVYTCKYTSAVEFRFLEPPRETEIGSRNREVRNIGGNSETSPRETTFGSSYWGFWEIEGSRNRGSIVQSTSNDSNLQGNLKNVPVIGSSSFRG